MELCNGLWTKTLRRKSMGELGLVIKMEEPKTADLQFPCSSGFCRRKLRSPNTNDWERCLGSFSGISRCAVAGG